jgi:hypothetical protein
MAACVALADRPKPVITMAIFNFPAAAGAA